jgi:hypothetical protein
VTILSPVSWNHCWLCLKWVLYLDCHSPLLPTLQGVLFVFPIFHIGKLKLREVK